MTGTFFLSRVRRVFFRGLLGSALVGALSLAATEAASAQTPFQATVTATNTVPSLKAGGCSSGAFFCGTANIAGYGPASWNLFVIENTNVQTSCGSTYTATTDFTLLSDPTSTLVLNEGGYLCGPGLNANGYFKGGSKDFGRPYTAFGQWTTGTDCSASVPPGALPCSTGVFAGLGGSGTDTLQIAGAHIAGSYTGTLN